jgi:hypothetical protein
MVDTSRMNDAQKNGFNRDAKQIQIFHFNMFDAMEAGQFGAVDTEGMSGAQLANFNRKAKEAGALNAVDTSNMNAAQVNSFNREA